MKFLKIKAGFFAVLGLLIIDMTISAQNPNFYIYLCFGQSNMQGQGIIESQDLNVCSRFKVLQALDCPNLNRVKGQWYTAVPPTCQCYSKLSPADYFGRTMVANLPDSITIGIINVAVGGCDIRLFDKDIYFNYDSTYTESWFTSMVAAYDWNPYKYLINLAKLAKKDGVIKGILLHQGETNTGDVHWPSYVKKIYNDMLVDLSLKADSVPLLAGEVLSAPGNCCSSMNQIIDRLPDTIPTAHIISSSGCTGQDQAHFDSPGYRILGKRYADQMLSLMGYKADYDGTGNPCEAKTTSTVDIPYNGYSLNQNYPNPVSNRSVTFSFKIPDAGFVSLNIVDSSGIKIDELAAKVFTAGEHEINYDIENLTPGIYFYTMKSGYFKTTRKMIVASR